jgi:hypothetical protein
VAEQVSLLVPDQAHNRPVGGDAEHLARFVAGDVQVAFGIEGHLVGEAGRGGDLFYRASVGLDAVDLSALSPTPHAPIPMHGEPLLVV